jgi:hypothetical protein
LPLTLLVDWAQMGSTIWILPKLTLGWGQQASNDSWAGLAWYQGASGLDSGLVGVEIETKGKPTS